MELNGRTALLTGATGGLGNAIAKALADRGAKLVLSARRAEALESLAAQLPGEGHRAVPADLGEEGGALGLIAEAGDVDILVANAGLPGTGQVSDFSVEEMQRALRVNLEGPMLMARELVPRMRERGAGHLVFVSSLAGKAPAARSAVYNATKFGLRGFAFGLRADLPGTGVGSSVVSPGFIRDAGMFADAGGKAPAGLGTSSPEDVAAAVVRAIEADKHEIVVAPLRTRALSHLGLATPGLAIKMAGGSTGTKAASDLAARQTDKR